MSRCAPERCFLGVRAGTGLLADPWVVVLAKFGPRVVLEDRHPPTLHGQEAVAMGWCHAAQLDLTSSRPSSYVCRMGLGRQDPEEELEEPRTPGFLTLSSMRG